ncbi:hypothetical protein DSOL_4080 [Desulfosporosinus metallidurans]|uniref:GGDEF domain-containing protein n=1 Tax=Desulfosporosinus metallidurans TaxID=1888891 RepID=A0A1Q8QM55_9FIRM|nr:hypothetical protein DSOL_4080 [Desulfosporosinus metallidurans]
MSKSKLSKNIRVGFVTLSLYLSYKGGNFRCASLDRAGDEFLKRADEALYQAKSKGKNRVVSKDSNVFGLNMVGIISRR